MASKPSASTTGRPSGRPHAAVLIIRFLGVSVLAGVLMAGVLLPAVSTLGMSAKSTSQSFSDLPGDFKRPPLMQASHIFDVKGNLLATTFERDRTLVDGKDISPLLKQSLVAIEDDRFYDHGAVDFKAVLRALNQNAQSDGVSQGGSTLTQQYVKNVFVEKAGDDPKAVAQAQQQTIGRKIKELKYAIKVEEEFTKDEILANYLNITFFGQKAYGAEAAARRYFSTTAKKLTLPQAAMLAGLVQSPSAYDPITAPNSATTRRNQVLQRLYETGKISKSEAEEAKATKLGLKVSRPKSGCITADQGAGFFCDYVETVLKHDPAFGKTKKERDRLWREGGLKITTTLDPQAQRSAQRAVSKHIYASDPVAGAVTMVEPGTGRITAMAQSRPYGFDLKKNNTVINYSVDKGMGGGMGAQPGSTFKPFTAAAALEKGLGAATTLPSPYRVPYPSLTDCQGRRYIGSDSAPNEMTSEVGPYHMREALAKSINTYFVQLEGKIGLCSILNMTKSLGIEKRAGGTQLGLGGSYTLGVNETSPLTMASAYAAFASRGRYCTPIALDSVTGPNGKNIAVPKSKCERVMTRQTADKMNGMLKGVVQDGSGQEAGLSDRESAGKTGTTDERRSAWFVGYTPQLSTAVMMYDPARKVKMIDITIGGKYFGKVYGRDGPAPIWNTAMSGAMANKPVENFRPVPLPPRTTPKKDDDKDKDKDKKKDKDRDHDRGDRGDSRPGDVKPGDGLDLGDLLDGREERGRRD